MTCFSPKMIYSSMLSLGNDLSATKTKKTNHHVILRQGEAGNYAWVILARRYKNKLCTCFQIATLPSLEENVAFQIVKNVGRANKARYFLDNVSVFARDDVSNRRCLTQHIIFTGWTQHDSDVTRANHLSYTNPENLPWDGNLKSFWQYISRFGWRCLALNWGKYSVTWYMIYGN